MGECPVELARVPGDSCCRVEDTLQLVGRLLRGANQETAAIIDTACDECMNECSESRHEENVGCGVVVIVEKALSTNNVDMLDE